MTSTKMYEGRSPLLTRSAAAAAYILVLATYLLVFSISMKEVPWNIRRALCLFDHQCLEILSVDTGNGHAREKNVYAKLGKKYCKRSVRTAYHLSSIFELQRLHSIIFSQHSDRLLQLPQEPPNIHSTTYSSHLFWIEQVQCKCPEFAIRRQWHNTTGNADTHL